MNTAETAASPVGAAVMKFLLPLALLLAFSLSLIGANWGRVECWNLDQMVFPFRGIQHNGLPCGGYLKPPLHTYLNHLLVLKPIEGIRHRLTKKIPAEYPFQLVGARLLTIVMFCGMIALLHSCVSRASGNFVAGILALLAATSAGLLEFNHFATADSPLLFWMIASVAMACRTGVTGSSRDAVIAGLLAGFATADKYNGLGVALALPVALITAQGWKALLGMPMWAGAAAAPIGFVIGNPGALFDTRNFFNDFLYNLYTTPVYSGELNRIGYLQFLQCIPNLIGYPGTLFLFFSLLLTGLLLTRGKLHRDERLLIFAAGSVVLFYYVTIGRFPRMADRFVLPVIPFLMLMAAPGIRAMQRYRAPLIAVALLILTYNIACSIELGTRFMADPRMDAQRFAENHFPRGSVIENTYAPDWKRLPTLDVTVNVMPFATGRAQRFGQIFGNNPVIAEGIRKYESPAYDADTFTVTGLRKRNPDFVAFSNQVYQFTGDDQAQRFYRDLDEGRLGYRRVFDQSWRPMAWWSYPRDVDFLAERMVILKRID
jgi:Dolichyl-phosphate-mannose-protein mannosyltransferase